LGLDRDISDGVNYREVSTRENKGFTKVSTEGTKAEL